MISEDLELAATLLANDEVVGLPTETVYGLAGNAFSEKAIERIYSIKNRPKHHPLILHISQNYNLLNVVSELPAKAQLLAEHFWPGPLTLLLPKSKKLPNSVTAGNAQIAIRIPNHPITISLLNKIDFPLVAPSANPFGSISPTTAKHVHNYFHKEIKLVLDGGACQKGLESTIIGFKEGKPILYRYGAIALEEIEKIIGKVTVFNRNDINPEAPGMISKHYAPQTKIILTNNIIDEIQHHADKKIGLLLFNQEIEHPSVSVQINLSPTGNTAEAAANLYQALHQLDEQKLDLIIAQRFSPTGLGNTINDRLERAAKN